MSDHSVTFRRRSEGDVEGEGDLEYSSLMESREEMPAELIDKMLDRISALSTTLTDRQREMDREREEDRKRQREMDRQREEEWKRQREIDREREEDRKRQRELDQKREAMEERRQREMDRQREEDRREQEDSRRQQTELLANLVARLCRVELSMGGEGSANPEPSRPRHSTVSYSETSLAPVTSSSVGTGGARASLRPDAMLSPPGGKEWDPRSQLPVGSMGGRLLGPWSADQGQIGLANRSSSEERVGVTPHSLIGSAPPSLAPLTEPGHRGREEGGGRGGGR